MDRFDCQFRDASMDRFDCGLRDVHAQRAKRGGPPYGSDRSMDRDRSSRLRIGLVSRPRRRELPPPRRIVAMPHAYAEDTQETTESQYAAGWNACQNVRQWHGTDRRDVRSPAAIGG